jgi:SAM-dependent methyltransferase
MNAHIIKRVKELGIRNSIQGFIKKIRYEKLQRTYGFDSWHVSPLELRKYAIDVVEYLNDDIGKKRMRGGVMVEIGCGLGDILRRIDKKSKHTLKLFGFDIGKEEIAAAKYLNKDNNIIFSVGTFNDVPSVVHEDIDCLLALNFIHIMDAVKVKEDFRKLFDKKHVKFVVIDHCDNTEYTIPFDTLLPDIYNLCYSSETYSNGRTVKIYRRGSSGD